MTTTAEIDESAGQLAELLKQVQAGHEVLLTQGHKPVARLVAAQKETGVQSPFHIRSFHGHHMLNPLISSSELAGEMFDRP